ncbi:multicopper oxidase family protein [Mesorhizobium sediminum]|uniref:Multicopper oxidase family protein n=1 Tax=Neoaquamicrobium sediminum TaxID=1849104 RepID=A0ABV3WZA6_9HYPH
MNITASRHVRAQQVALLIGSRSPIAAHSRISGIIAMNDICMPALSRRNFLTSLLATAVLPWATTSPGAAAPNVRQFRLRAATGTASLNPRSEQETGVWAYNKTVPGPELRVRQGDRLRIMVENGLAKETTVHWHGVRTPNAMDGVPHLTQRPIATGDSFAYEFDALDAGTFWYHPHQRSFEQVDRGLYGALVIEEANPIPVDRDLVWVLDDWRLTHQGDASDDFGHPHDAAHNGRMGNIVTINGQVPETFEVRRGERIRLRLINAANARIFGLDFRDHQPVVIALDGQPVTPHSQEAGRIVLGPAMRADIVLDCTGRPGERFTIEDTFYTGLEYNLLTIAYQDEPLREAVPDWPLELPANPLAEPDFANALRHEVLFTGGMMGAMVMQEMGLATASGGTVDGMGAMMRGGGIWLVNGVAAEGHVLEPMLALPRGKSCVLAMTNATAWHHPIHLHGHSFRVISRDGAPTSHREWRDTVLMAPRERIEIAFVADNPGDWMFHCHILEHQASGMTSVIRVA